MVRSGYYIYSSYRCCRCGYRTQLNKEWSSTAVSVGFRLNGVMRSGQFNWTYTSYMRSGFRRGGRIANSASGNDIGFRL